MAATDQTYRNQRTLDVVFAVSCVLMLLSVLWMLADDYNQGWKVVQRDFRDVETARNMRLMLENLPSVSEVKARDEEVKKARELRDKVRQQVGSDEKRLTAERESADTSYRTIKADFDSRMSYFVIDTEHFGKSVGSERERLAATLAGGKSNLERLEKQLQEARDRRDALDKEIRDKVREKEVTVQVSYQPEPVVTTLAKAEDALSAAEDRVKALTGAMDRFAKTAVQKNWGLGDAFRALPILDSFASPTRINQIVLNDLTIDYGGFRDVPRFDRCTTCHLGIDRSGYDKSALHALTHVPPGLEEKLKSTRRLFLARKAAGEDLGFDPEQLPDTLGTVKLSRAQLTQYASHPRLDLFVESNSPHPAQKFGCTICHAGQGSATSFNLSAHMPADVRQQQDWEREHGWKSNHFWDFPMLSSRFVESGCLKCHHQVTDLIRHGDKEEAPKLLKGYNLVRELGCFGCHEIQGQKGGRSVGPDLRLEPTPPLEWLPAAEQEKAKADTMNPPGAYRKVGPSLRRLAEKTNEEWTRKWIALPRGFRPDTRMPHFYNVANNGFEALAGTGQEHFPDAEIHAIAHYLFAESERHLDGKDTTRTYLLERLHDLEGRFKKGKLTPLTDKERKELDAVTRNFADLALLSAPARGQAINDLAARLGDLHNRLQELSKAPSQAGADDVVADMEKARAALVKEGMPIPLAKELLSYDGAAVEMPGAGDVARGRKLFTERGCLACHQHEGTTRPEGGKAVTGDAVFGPDLSRLAAKLMPEVKGVDARRWLVQWLMNPSIHHPRTRMPVTFLTPADAGSIADWLLSQKVTDWKQDDVPAPDEKTVRQLARLYLSKAPGMTRLDVDTFLPEEGDIKGIPADRLAGRPDAEERVLSKPKVERSDLLWYIGKKSINRLGCFGCHDLPGFETAKPIGTGLNDWGKKDAERLAFEDGAAFVHDHFNIVPEKGTRKDLEARIRRLDRESRIAQLRARPKRTDDEAEELRYLRELGPLTDEERAELKELRERAEKEPYETKESKAPYEEFFYEALEHQTRQGFLHLKLAEPRSYDYRRLRVWDDRLRMPQFRFARKVQRLKGESDADYEARQQREEADAREAVMTFILGLVAEPVPLKHVASPEPDKLAEARGRQVLDKFNCAGCHQIRGGVYDFKPSDETLKALTEASQAAATDKTDFKFPWHNAWVGTNPIPTDRIRAFGVERPVDPTEELDRPTIKVTLTEALRFNEKSGVTRNVPAGVTTMLYLPQRDLIDRTPPLGGRLGDLLVPHVIGTPEYNAKDRDAALNLLPPPLNREGERVQPNWVYQFVLNPYMIRPHVLLRMPRFNMSSDDATALSAYFNAVSRLDNPGSGTTRGFVKVPQTEPGFWEQRTKEYVEKMGGPKSDKVKARLKALEPSWEQYVTDQVAEAKRDVDQAKAVLAAAKEMEKETAKQAVDAASKRLDGLQKKLKDKDFKDLDETWLTRDAYAADAYRLLWPGTGPGCTSCHSIEGRGARQAPALDQVHAKLRPHWAEEWIARPDRMFPYKPAMPNNFKPGETGGFAFDGDAREQIMAVRDVLLYYPMVAEMPANRYYRPVPRPVSEGAK